MAIEQQQKEKQHTCSLVVISFLLDAAGPTRGKATFGNNLKRNHEKWTQNKEGRTVTKSIVWWNSASVCGETAPELVCVCLNSEKAQRKSEQLNQSKKQREKKTI